MRKILNLVKFDMRLKQKINLKRKKEKNEYKIQEKINKKMY